MCKFLLNYKGIDYDLSTEIGNIFGRVKLTLAEVFQHDVNKF